jgi:ActR/RegA family two-component response regulator
MRVLIADRNARLLESISRTFAPQFRIQTATSSEDCNALLQQGEFDLAVISEKLADGPGLQLLGQIARDSPDTLRIFAARRSRLQLLKGKLGPFGLFRTLAYPIDPQKLLSALTLARTGLEIDVPVSAPLQAIRGDSIEARKAGRVYATRAKAASPLQAPHPSAAILRRPAAVRPTVERISLTSADAMFVVNVPQTIASTRKVRRSGLSSVSRPPPSVRQAPPARNVASKQTREKDEIQQSAMLQPGSRSSAPRWTPPQREVLQPAVQRRKAAGRATAAHARRNLQLTDTAPKRTRVLLGAAIVAVFLVTILTVNLLGGGSAHVTRAAVAGPEIARLDIPSPPWKPTPAAVEPAFRPVQSVVQRAEPIPSATDPDADPRDPQMTASTAPVADPSTFGSEAYEPIYSN